MNRPQAILIAGPTASGKSALAIRLAQRLGGIVINADSMQVYRDLRIITARPTEAEEASAPHRLFGAIDGAENFSVTRWLTAVADEMALAKTHEHVPIFVGGTGLYFKALTQGLSDIPPVPEDVRASVRANAEGRMPEDLHAELALLDPLAAAKLRPSDPQRILRALEVFAATGRSLLSFQNSRSVPLLDLAHCRSVFLDVDRTALRERTDRRFDRMMADGALDEVVALSARDLADALPIMRGHGIPPLLAHLRHGLPLEDAIETGKADTRRYIKRQETFARHQLPGFSFVDADAAERFLLEAAC